MDNQNVLNEVNGSIKTQESVSNSVSTKNSSVQLGSQLILTSKENACAQPTIDSKSGDSIKTIGKITYNRSILLGKGAGTFVYQGTYDNRKEKAIKKIHCEDKLDTQRRMKEVDILLKLDNNQNVVKYFGTEHDDDFLYIALEQFNGTLQQWMDEEISKIPKESITLLDTLKQSTQVLAYLHKNNIIHRDLKPENILLRVSASGIQVKLADFGISKVVPDGRNTVTQTRHIGTKGWKAPEILMFGNVEKPQMSSETDIFSLGCIFYYVLSNGKHPFGIDSNSREVHIKEEKSFLAADDLPILLQGNLLLIEEMIKTDRKKRPNVHDVLAHHIFWPVSKTWDFLLDMGDLMAKLEAENQKTRSEDVVIVALKRRQSNLLMLTTKWMSHQMLRVHLGEPQIFICNIGF
ncbi:unnamed protein product [Orchesella dallaii]|uniref:Protein kinase domain-containing protein n=1 Tax=Orchesella dallaii TaxID=48710 RepID=A0ABP1PHX5_9HEXA